MIKFSEIKIKSKVEWNSINWKKIQLRIWRIQKKIYYASRQNNKLEVIKLQKILINLSEAKLLAVRKVTQENGRCRWCAFISTDKKVTVSLLTKNRWSM
jgi:hypothetical protein